MAGPKEYPRKYLMTDRSPLQIRTFSGSKFLGSDFWTPLLENADRDEQIPLQAGTGGAMRCPQPKPTGCSYRQRSRDRSDDKPGTGVDGATEQGRNSGLCNETRAQESLEIIEDATIPRQRTTYLPHRTVTDVLLTLIEESG